MKSKTNTDAEISKKIICIGCSWSRYWPQFIDKITQVKWEGYCGKGLDYLSGVLNNKELIDYDYIVIQLPTPIRSIDKKNGKKTLGLLFDFIGSFKLLGEKKACSFLLSYYKDKILTISEKLESRVVFFLYNVGGYPFRCPFDFGRDIDLEFIDFFNSNELDYVYLSFEGRSGYGLKESNTKPMLNQHIVHPDDCFIIDPHPNGKADKEAALVIERYICEKENQHK